MKQRLALFAMAVQVARATILSNLGHMPYNRFPSFYLAQIIDTSATHMVAAVPLEPTPRILWVYPSFLSPNR
jgi:hypothetical protein